MLNMFLSLGHVTKRTDVYAFGVLVLEIITGLQAAFSRKGRRRKILAEWARPHLKKEGQKPDIVSLMDPYLQDEALSTESKMRVEFLALIARRCLGPARERPTMRDVSDSLLTLVKDKI